MSGNLIVKPITAKLKRDTEVGGKMVNIRFLFRKKNNHKLKIFSFRLIHIYFFTKYFYKDPYVILKLGG